MKTGVAIFLLLWLSVFVIVGLMMSDPVIRVVLVAVGFFGFIFWPLGKDK